jgi:O-antigen ligase
MPKKEATLSFLIGTLLATFLFTIFSFKMAGILAFFLLGIAVLLYINKISIKFIILLLLFFSVVAPPIRIQGSPYIRMELLLVVAAWFLFAFGKAIKGEEIKIKWSSAHRWFFYFGGAIIMSLVFVFLVFNIKPASRDFFELAKLLEYFLLFSLAFTANITKEDLKKYYPYILLIFGVAALIGIIQYFNLFPSFNRKFIEYVAPAHVDGWLRHKRIVGTTGGPNDFGMLMAAASLFALTGFLWLKKFKHKAISLAFMFLFGLSLILTLSRSAFAAFFAGAAFVIFLKYPKKQNVKGRLRLVFLILPILIILSLSLYLVAPPKFMNRINSAVGMDTDRSLQKRLITWRFNFDIYRQSPVFGWGPSKDLMGTIVDNEWLLLLRRYGLFGTLVFVGLFLKLYRGMGRALKKDKESSFSDIFPVFGQAFIVSSAIYMIPASFYHSLQLMPILVLFLGIAYPKRGKITKSL